MEMNMLRKALWVFLKPLITLIANLLNPEKGEEWLAELKKFNRKEPCWVRVAMANMIIRRVRVNRERSPETAISATGRKKYLNDQVVGEMPRGLGNEAEVVFFKPEDWEYTRSGFMSDDDFEKALDRRGLKPADPYSLAAANEADPAFADEYPNGTHWKDATGNWCYAVFHRWFDERYVRVRVHDNNWDDYWWFAGLRKRRLVA